MTKLLKILSQGANFSREIFYQVPKSNGLQKGGTPAKFIWIAFICYTIKKLDTCSKAQRFSGKRNRLVHDFDHRSNKSPTFAMCSGHPRQTLSLGLVKLRSARLRSLTTAK